MEILSLFSDQTLVQARDLSAWRVTVPRLEARSLEGRALFAFVIQVTRINTC